VALTYDGLNRVTLKNYDGNCSTTTDVTYTYDQGTNGIGHRTYMGYGSSYNTTWTYATRGRMTSVKKAIDSGRVREAASALGGVRGGEKGGVGWN